MIKEKYTDLKFIGEGTYGKLYSATNSETGELVALKMIKKQQDEEGVSPSTVREISLLKELKHINVLKLHEVKTNVDKITMVLEYVPRDLKQVIEETNNGKGLNKINIKSYLYQLIKGIEYIHKHKILHRDLKPANILVSKEDVIKIADFGLARGSGLPVLNYSSEVVTLWYRPPDVLLGNKDYSTSLDIWSIGCIFAEMIIGKALFAGLNENNQLNKIFRIMGTPSEKEYPNLSNYPDWKQDAFENFPPQDLKQFVPDIDNDGYDLLEKMLRLDPNKRILTSEALEHPYFKDIIDTLKDIYK